MRARTEDKSLEQTKIEQILQHFKDEFPLDPITPYARFFAKRSHGDCNGTGLLTFLKPEQQSMPVAELRFCSCALRRRDRFVTKALLFESARARGGHAFAEGTVCASSEVALPTNPAKAEVAQILAAANDAQIEAVSP
jgi:hypothetical protein